MSTVAIVGAGANISFAAHGANTFTTFAQIKTFNITPPTLKFDDVTNLGSPLVGNVVVEESLPVSITPGKFSATIVYNPSDTSLANVRTAFNGTQLSDFKVQLAKGGSQTTTGDLYTFTGYFSAYPMPTGVTYDKHIEATIDVQTTGAWSFTQGS